MTTVYHIKQKLQVLYNVFGVPDTKYLNLKLTPKLTLNLIVNFFTDMIGLELTPTITQARVWHSVISHSSAIHIRTFVLVWVHHPQGPPSPGAQLRLRGWGGDGVEM